jgi:hypothetical protein
MLGPRNDEGSYWGTRKWTDTKLPEISACTDNPRALCWIPVEKLKWSNKKKTGQEASSSLWSRKWFGWALSFDGKKFFCLTVADVMHLAYQLAVSSGIKNQFYNINWKTGRKWLKNFLHHHLHQEFSVTTPEGLHSWDQGVSLMDH